MPSKSSNFRTTYILMGVFAVILGVLAIYVFFDDGRKPNPDGNLLETFQSLKIRAGDITSLEIEKGNEKIVLNRQPDGRWRMMQPVEGRADSTLVDNIVSEVLTVRRDDKGADITSNLATHGLDAPAVKITLHKGERSTWLTLGKTTIGGEQAVVYVLSADDPNTPHATKRNRLKDLFKTKPPENAGTAEQILDKADLHTRKLLGEGLAQEAAPSQLRSITLTEKTPTGERIVKLVRQHNVWQFEIPRGYGDVELEVPPDKRNPNTIYNLSSLLNNVLSIEVPAAKDFLRESRDLAALGLDPLSNGILRIDLERGDAIGKETLWIGKGTAKGELDKVYVRYAGDAAVAQVNGEKARMLFNFMKDPSLLRDTTLVKFRRDHVDALNLVVAKMSFELRKLSGKWKLFANGKTYDADTGEIDALLQKLSQPREVRGFPPADASTASLGLEAPAVEVSVWEDSISPALKFDPNSCPTPVGPPIAQLQFGKKEGDDLVVVRRLLGKNHADFKMPAELLKLASRGYLDYVDISLTPFDVEKVEKLTFTRDGETWELQRDASNLPVDAAVWTILSPASKKGKLANAAQIAVILKAFNETKADRVFSENATPAQLADWGLDPAKPVFKLVLKFKENPTERVYELGNPIAGTLNVYTKTSLSNYVFAWNRSLAKLELVTKGRLLDPILYRLEAGDVKGMKLRGWVDPAKPEEPQILEFERKPGGIWSTKGKYVIDELRVEEFFQNISRPQSIEQVPGPKAEQKLDVKQGALEIVIDLGGGKTVTLTLGGRLDDGKQIYVTTNQAPGEVFTIDGERLLPVKDRAAALLAK